MNTLSTDCELLQELQVRRRYTIAVKNRMINALGALVRREMGWHAELPKTESEAIKTRARNLIACRMADKPVAPDDVTVYDTLKDDIFASLLAVSTQTTRLAAIEKTMRTAAKALPVWQWVEPIRGFGELGLAVIIGETGNLSNYDAKNKVWKRLGLHTYRGKAISQLRKADGVTAEQWRDIGYSPKRRAEIHACVSDSLFRHQTISDGPYREVYDKRHAHCMLTHPEWGKAKPNMHRHMDAARIMTKVLVADLYSAWKRMAVETSSRRSGPDVTRNESSLPLTAAPIQTVSAEKPKRRSTTTVTRYESNVSLTAAPTKRVTKKATTTARRKVRKSATVARAVKKTIKPTKATKKSRR